MKKFECNDCEADCELTIQMDEFMPRYCLCDTEKADWHEVKEDSAENEHTPVKSEQLPAWVKVGAVGYDDMNNEYFEVIEVNNDSFRAKSIGSSDSCSALYFNEFCSEAHKRPFNEAEMKALVGKVIGRENNLELVISYNAADGDVYVDQMWCSAKYLMDNEYTIDGKPCYKFEHLNEKGEWVE